MTRKELAIDYFKQGYNCSQSVVLAFSDLIGADTKTLAKISSSFGGGMGRLREVCGAVTGSFMVIGMLYGYDSPEAKSEKADLYRMIQNFAAESEKENGSIICRKLLGLDTDHSSPVPAERTAEYYKKRPCVELVGVAAEMLEKFIQDNPIVQH